VASVTPFPMPIDAPETSPNGGQVLLCDIWSRRTPHRAGLCTPVLQQPGEFEDRSHGPGLVGEAAGEIRRRVVDVVGGVDGVSLRRQVHPNPRDAAGHRRVDDVGRVLAVPPRGTAARWLRKPNPFAFCWQPVEPLGDSLQPIG
jgi:hypothetical protein